MHHPSAGRCRVHSSCILLLSSFFIRSVVVVALQTPLLSSLSSSPGILTYKEKKGFESCHLPLNIDIGNTITMIVRVRNNLGTMKFSIDDDAGAMASTVRDAVMQECRQRQQRDNNSSTKYKLTQALSFDPSCTHAIDPYQTLRSQGIRHGSMVYCRLEEEAEAAEEEENLRHPLRDANISKNSGGKAKVTTKKEIDVIDLVDSQFASAPSTEEETSDAVVAFNINADAVFNEDNNIPFVHATTNVNNSSRPTTNTTQTPIVYSTGQPPQPPPQQPPQPRLLSSSVATTSTTQTAFTAATTTDN